MKMTVLEAAIVLAMLIVGIAVSWVITDRNSRESAYQEIASGKVILCVQTNVNTTTNYTYRLKN